MSVVNTGIMKDVGEILVVGVAVGGINWWIGSLSPLQVIMIGLSILYTILKVGEMITGIPVKNWFKKKVD